MASVSSETDIPTGCPDLPSDHFTVSSDNDARKIPPRNPRKSRYTNFPLDAFDIAGVEGSSVNLHEDLFRPGDGLGKLLDMQDFCRFTKFMES